MGAGGTTEGLEALMSWSEDADALDRAADLLERAGTRPLPDKERTLNSGSRSQWYAHGVQDSIERLRAAAKTARGIHENVYRQPYVGGSPMDAPDQERFRTGRDQYVDESDSDYEKRMRVQYPRDPTWIDPTR
jgi:hypothetical protein